MSFFRNIRTSITRGRSSSRDTTPAPGSRPASTVSSTAPHNNHHNDERRESIDSRTESLFNRSDTFILNSDQEEKSASNDSTLEKKSKKSKVLSKFSTFTKRKKTPSPELGSCEHHPSDNATNTYYKWKTDGAQTLDYDSQSDPFHFLYEQHSSLKSRQHGNAEATTRTEMPRYNGNTGTGGTFDSSTYRKNKVPTYLREQLAQLKTNSKSDLRELKGETPEPEEEIATQDNDKYKTITLNSFRKSFRDKFLQQQNDVPHNPAWFVEVEPPPKPADTRSRRQSKENRPDFLVFDNENYRPTSRSPVRSERSARSNTRSPVKRNETFRVERANNSSPLSHSTLANNTPSIRIEIKNSITPNLPGRMVPVGVAKPMPYQQPPALKSHFTATTTASKSSPALPNRDKSPLRNWGKPITVSPVRHKSNSGRYQTLVQIRNEANSKPATASGLNSAGSSSTIITTPQQRGRLSTRIQLGAVSPTVQKRLHSAGARYSLATTTPATAALTGKHTLSSYELLRKASPNASGYTQPPRATTTQLFGKSSAMASPANMQKHTYFGDTQLTAGNYNNNNSNNINKSQVGVRTFGTAVSGYNTPASGLGGYAAAGKLQQQTRLPVAGSSNYYTRRDQQQQQQQQRYAVPVQRRSRSPIKMPWR